MGFLNRNNQIYRNKSQSSLSYFIRLLYPGYKIKRWLLIGGLGVFLVHTGDAYLVKHFLHISFPNFLPWYFEGFVLAVIAISFVVGSLVGLYKSLVPYFGATMFSSTGFAETIYTRRQQEKGPRIVAIGGGTGLSTLLRGMKEHSSNLTAIVTVADDGGSSGRLRREFGVLPPGDFRNCLIAMADAEPLVKRLFQYRFGEGTELEGHSFGNLFIVAMSGITGSFEKAIDESSQVLAVRGRIVPSTTENLTISAEMNDQTVIHGESRIPKNSGKINTLYLTPKAPRAYLPSVEAIKDAEIIIIGPGSLYTSILPNLLVPGIGKAIEESTAIKIFVCNVATQKGETDGFSVYDHVKTLRDHTSYNLVNHVLINHNIKPLGDEFTGTPVEDGRYPVKDVKLVKEDIINSDFRLHHDPERLATAIMKLYHDR